jgi:hypothetical protein
MFHALAEPSVVRDVDKKSKSSCAASRARLGNASSKQISGAVLVEKCSSGNVTGFSLFLPH